MHISFGHLIFKMNGTTHEMTVPRAGVEENFEKSALEFLESLVGPVAMSISHLDKFSR